MIEPDEVVAPDDLEASVVLATLRDAELRVEGQLTTASNATWRCLAELSDGRLLRCVYKPVAGERPLWDFPEGTLAAREVATALIDRQLGLDLVPPTTWRDSGPAGPGMCQAWIEHAAAPTGIDLLPPTQVPESWHLIAEGQTPTGEVVALVHDDSPELRRIALLDAIVNNADRKGGHVLVDATGRRWAIDHGVTFHVEDKLRTVLWGWAGTPVNAAERELLSAWCASSDSHAELGAYLDEVELGMLLERVDSLLATGTFPVPSQDWPSLPWPVM